MNKKAVICQERYQEVKDEYLFAKEEGFSNLKLTDIEKIMLDKVLIEGLSYKDTSLTSNLPYQKVRGGYIRGAVKLLKNKVKRKYSIDVCPSCGGNFKNYYFQNECNDCRKGDVVL